jgi:hypothetical protein
MRFAAGAALPEDDRRVSGWVDDRFGFDGRLGKFGVVLDLTDEDRVLDAMSPALEAGSEALPARVRRNVVGRAVGGGR